MITSFEILGKSNYFIDMTQHISTELMDGVYIVSKIFDRKQHCKPNGFAVRIVLCSLHYEQCVKCKIIKTASSLKLKVAVTIALAIQIHYGDYELVPHGSVATDSHKCSVLGTDILKQGGNAVDAAIASTLCVGIFNPHVTGLGGVGIQVPSSLVAAHWHLGNSSENAKLRELLDLLEAGQTLPMSSLANTLELIALQGPEGDPSFLNNTSNQSEINEPLSDNFWNFPEAVGSHVAAVDLDDLYVSVVSGLNTWHGSQLLTDGGFILNNALKNFGTGSNSPAPGKRPFTLAVPMIAVQHDQICGRRLVLGAGDATVAIQLLTRLLAFGDNATLGVEAPRFRVASGGTFLQLEEFLATEPEGLGSIPDTYRFFCEAVSVTGSTQPREE
uniref:Uncharacterized protein n=1 Tax=Timema tahoe TaxID=61484 RepID=A0A7R9ID06_9NEOP|nr:unnamed protein product [Timema tahoe]